MAGKFADLACNFIKTEILTQVFSYEFCEIFKNTFSYRTPPVAASALKYKRFLKENWKDVLPVSKRVDVVLLWKFLFETI